MEHVHRSLLIINHLLGSKKVSAQTSPRFPKVATLLRGLPSLSVANSRPLEEYPLTIADGLAHVEAVSKALSTFGQEARNTIDEAEELDDADTAYIFTEISRGLDKWLWFVEAHSQAAK